MLTAENLDIFTRSLEVKIWLINLILCTICIDGSMSKFTPIPKKKYYNILIFMNSLFAGSLGWTRFITVTRTPRYVVVRDWSAYFFVFLFFLKKINEKNKIKNKKIKVMIPSRFIDACTIIIAMKHTIYVRVDSSLHESVLFRILNWNFFLPNFFNPLTEII